MLLISLSTALSVSGKSAYILETAAADTEMMYFYW